MQIQCDFCGCDFNRKPSKISVGPNYCCPACYRKGQKQQIEERFWSYVDKTGSCWLWNGALYSTGYGAASLYKKTLGAHQAAWILVNGPIPAGRWVLHKCPGKNRKDCVNPEHLYLGDRGDNIRDAIERDEVRFGNQHPARKLTETLVNEIRQRFRDGEKVTPIARHYSVCHATVSLIVHNKIWIRLTHGDNKVY